MRKNIILAVFSAFLMLAASCQKTVVNKVKENGFLSFSEFSLQLDEDLITKASAAGNNYTIIVNDINGNEVVKKSYGEIKSNDNMISLPAGSYTLVARSIDEDMEVAAFEQPVYGASKDFMIEAGIVTPIGELTCTLLQCKVTVDYSDDFLATVTGDCTTTVELTAGYPLDYALAADKTYERSAGYFAVNGTTMTVRFKGHIDGYDGVTMTKTFTGIAPRQWRQVKFIPYVNEEGTATFDIVINDLISDEILNNELLAEEEVIGIDPNAPEDDGGIKFLLAEGCDKSITATEEDIVYDGDGNQINSTGIINIPIAPLAADGSTTMSILFDAVIPEGLAELTVDITTDAKDFAAAVDAAKAAHIDLVNPVCDPLIFDVVPFPHGEEILGAKQLSFDLTGAQTAIVAFKGTHVFEMTIVDVNGKTKRNVITMVVE